VFSLPSLSGLPFQLVLAASIVVVLVGIPPSFFRAGCRKSAQLFLDLRGRIPFLSPAGLSSFSPRAVLGAGWIL